MNAGRDPVPPLPHNAVAERAVLGGVILDNAAIRATGLSAADFFLPAHRRVFAAMQKLAAAGKPIEEISLAELLKSDGEVQAAGGTAYIAALADGLPRVSNVGRWAEIVKGKAMLRNLANAANALSLAALETDADPQGLQSRLRQLGEALVDGTEPRLRAVTAAELLSIEIPAREMVLVPILPAQGLAMMYSKRGVGKTHLAIGIACAVSAGGRFLRWNAPKPRSVLYVDGELPAVLLRDWVAEIAAGAEPGSVEQAALRFITPDLQSIPFPDLATREGQALIESNLAGVELVIFDNLSSLCRTGKENEGESWLPLQEWALQLRRRGISVLFLHHAGRAGEWARGTSRREDLLDTVIALRHPADYSPAEGLRCEVHYEKCRGFFGGEAKPFEAKMHSDPSGAAAWVMRDVDDVVALRAAELFADGMSIRDVAEELRISKSKAHRLKQKAVPARGGVMAQVSHCPRPYPWDTGTEAKHGRGSQP